jgi:hypothetical protein
MSQGNNSKPQSEASGKSGSRPIVVQTQSGFKQDEQPRAFELEGKRFTVLSIKKTWKEESDDGRRHKVFFRVHTHEGRSHDIARNENTGEWTLEPFSSGLG